MDTGSFPGVKRPGRGVDNPLASGAEIKEIVDQYLHTPIGLHDPVLGRNLLVVQEAWGPGGSVVVKALCY
jgi:hypothetical protein